MPVTFVTDTNGQPVCDQCQLQYRGPHCDKCKDGYYGSDSICMPCECNGNVDSRTSPRVCDPDTGQCLNCSNNTAGKHCEKCAEGYVGEDCSELCKGGCFLLKYSTRIIIVLLLYYPNNSMYFVWIKNHNGCN